MRLRFDPVKAVANLEKHKVSFADAEGVFRDPLAITIEDPDAEGERRYVAIGLGTPAISWSWCTPSATRNAD